MAKTVAIVRLAGLALGALIVAMPPAAAGGPTASVNDTAHVLAGMAPSPGSPLNSVTSDANWQVHAKGFDSAWTGLENRQLNRVRTWSSKNFDKQRSTLYYFFSGPDFMYADAFFPNADTYIMAGLEPPGSIPNLQKMSRPEINSAISELRSSLNSVMNYSFFITKHMKVDLNQGRVVGTVPVLMVFLARSGKTIYDISFYDLQSDGTLHAVDDKVANATAKAAKITFSDGIGKKRTLYYFSTDVSNAAIKNTGFLTFCEKFGKGDAFLKSASYLLHNDSFSTIRDYLLTNADTLLQDDSGIPIRYLAKGWKLNPFGAYVGPIPLFYGQTQPALYQLFGKGRASGMDFGLGYQFRPTRSNLLLARKDPSATFEEQVAGKPGNQLKPTSASIDSLPGSPGDPGSRRTSRLPQTQDENGRQSLS